MGSFTPIFSIYYNLKFFSQEERQVDEKSVQISPFSLVWHGHTKETRAGALLVEDRGYVRATLTGGEQCSLPKADHTLDTNWSSKDQFKCLLWWITTGNERLNGIRPALHKNLKIANSRSK
jgi:hypothetical protein